MPNYFHPGVYIEESPSRDKPIEGVSTSIAAFIAYGLKGPIGEATLIHKWEDYIETYGGVISSDDVLGLAVSAFYLNGGRAAYIVRLAPGALPSKLPDTSIVGRAGGSADGVNVLSISASSPGTWGNKLRVFVTNSDDGIHFKLEVGFLDRVNKFAAEEVFDNLSMDDTDINYVLTVVNASSKYVTVDLSSKLKTKPTSYYMTGTSVSDVLTDMTWGDVKENMTLTLNVDGLGVKTIALGPPNGDSYTSGEEVMNEIADRVQELGSHPAYANFRCSFASNTLTLTSGTQGSSSCVVVRPGDLATLLKLGVAAGGNETHGTVNVVPCTSANKDGVALTGGKDGLTPGESDYRSYFSKLKKIRNISILVLPGQHMAENGTGNPIIDAAITHCETTKNRMLLVDPPHHYELDQKIKVEGLGLTTSIYAALYYPWVKVTNPLYNEDTNPNASKTLTIAPSAFAAGMWARIDGTRGVWKAPAGVETQLRGVADLELIVEDDEQDQLNPLGVNCLRKMPGYGAVIWGTRTLATNAVPEWRYVPIRRTAIYIEQSIYDGIQWAVFEPNDPRLWGSLRANIGAFMNGLFRAGAFQGEKASDAYFVRCALGDTMTQNDINRGMVHVIVGFAPLKPAEFVIVHIQQKVAQQ